MPFWISAEICSPVISERKGCLRCSFEGLSLFRTGAAWVRVTSGPAVSREVRRIMGILVLLDEGEKSDPNGLAVEDEGELLRDALVLALVERGKRLYGDVVEG